MLTVINILYIDIQIVYSCVSDVISTFEFTCPPKKPNHDKDGDLIVCRKPKQEKCEIIEIGNTNL